MALSPDAAILAIAYGHGPPILWDAVSGARLNILGDHSDNVWVVAFSPDGATLLSNYDDHAVRLWNTASGVTTKVLEEGRNVNSAIYSPDGNMIATGSDFVITLWNARDGLQLFSIFLARDLSGCKLVFSPDSAFISTILYQDLTGGGFRSLIRLWDVTS
ncbi:WD40 repeat-like protein, partial [Athelia psychrophila]